jgi:hypothetical protein
MANDISYSGTRQGTFMPNVVLVSPSEIFYQLSAPLNHFQHKKPNIFQIQSHMRFRMLQQRRLIVKMPKGFLREQHLRMMPSKLLPMILLLFHQP